MSRALAAALAFSISAPVAAADDGAADPLGPAPAVSVGSFAYAIRGYLSSTIAVLSGLDASYDHDLRGSYGLRFRGGMVILGIDEITGFAPHGEAGVFQRFALGPRVALDASLLAGYYHGGLDHKEEWEDRPGPTAMAEIGFYIAVVDHVQAAVGGGYRLAWTAEEHGDDRDPFASGPLLRFNLGVSF